ncbi:unnamed protein product [Polarella glacialis]|uniref:Glycosyltransferase 2-like domain-containing protein n=1 Tax=Polarella glacialis TaxID=89957 RepID=A0A813HLI4_POLGL|nr:unnamed protein product [Polarella glacialis]
MGSVMFYAITACLTAFTIYYSSDLCISSMIGAWRMRKAASEDWHAKLTDLIQENPEFSDVMHIVILPNYKENEQMLFRTLENLGESPMARTQMKVVLGMEEREGPVAREKADRLIAKTSHMFADIFASYHPANLPGDQPGKSSNSQWAYLQMLQRYSNDLSKRDTSRVLLSVGDADTLWHVQYWSALAYEALTLPVKERVWSFWQPPMLLLRNLFSCPSVTRVTGYATCLFELAGLANQIVGPAFCYSSYSMTLAMATHHLVGGWDRDVIAEDHHMFCKCFFASILEGQSGTDSKLQMPGLPKVMVRPVFLPATSFLVESSDGWWASCYERYQQAVRHSQGISELSYTILQYILLIRKFGVSNIYFRTHSRICSIIYKMVAVHMINQVQAVGTIMVSLSVAPSLIRWVLSGGLFDMLGLAQTQGLMLTLGQQSYGGLATWAVASILGPIPYYVILMTITSYLVISSLLDGKLTQMPQSFAGKHGKKWDFEAKTDIQGYSPGCLSVWRKISIFLMITSDYFGVAHLTLFFFGLIPILKATYGLFTKGTKFDYIVAAKPN